MKNFPKISIVTPSFNQGEFLEQAILSVLEQNYPNLEYIIIDGGSTDNSVQIIKKYEKYLACWFSEKDKGQYHAINKGFERSSGEVMAWLNSDDMYCNWTFNVIAEIVTQHREIEWATSLFPMMWNDRGLAVGCYERPGYSRDAFMREDILIYSLARFYIISSKRQRFGKDHYGNALVAHCRRIYP